MSTWKDRWGRRPAELVEKVTKAVSGAVTPGKPGKPRERTGGYWPDEDLEELENPRPAGWLGRRRKGWLWGRR